MMVDAYEIGRLRRYFAEEIQAYCGLQSAALVEALASVARENFLGPGPWLFMGMDTSMGLQARQTADADPRHVYHNVSIAIDLKKQLFNGQPGTICTLIDALRIKPGERILHIGCATGYYTALIAHLAGPQGHVIAFEVDADLARRAKENLAAFDWVEVREADGNGGVPEDLDAILVNAGATHPLPAWLEALRPDGRMILPLTFAPVGMPQNIGKGGVLLATRDADGFAARFMSPVAIYSCVGVRSPSLNEALQNAFTKGAWFNVKRLRRDVHEAGSACWLHADGFCLSA
jgi:protein-L-isoaspartate(D-aspartate) O-methyltransferase